MKGKLINLKNLPKRLKKLNKEFEEIERTLLNKNLINLYEEIEKELLKKVFPHSLEGASNELEIELFSLKNLLIETVILFQTFLLDNQFKDPNVRRPAKGRGGHAEMKEENKEDKAYEILNQVSLTNL